MPLLRILVVLVLAAGVAAADEGRKTVEVRSGSQTLRAYLWRPAGRGTFPAILLVHGSGRTRADLARLAPYENQADALGQLFARHGYAFLYLFRRGVGLSADQGTSAVELMEREAAAHGQDARNALQLELLDGGDMADTRAGLALLRALAFFNSDSMKDKLVDGINPVLLNRPIDWPAPSRK